MFNPKDMWAWENLVTYWSYIANSKIPLKIPKTPQHVDIQHNFNVDGRKYLERVIMGSQEHIFLVKVEP